VRKVDHLAQALIKAREIVCMTDTAEIKNQATWKRIRAAAEETERLGGEIVAR